MASEFDRPLRRLSVKYALAADKIREFVADLETKGEIPHKLKDSKKKPSVGKRLLRLKHGAYLTREELMSVDLSRETETFRTRISDALQDITKHGNEALSHLCLEGRFQNALRRAGIATIPALESILERDGVSSLNYVNGGNFEGKQTVLSRVASFHQALRAEQARK